MTSPDTRVARATEQVKRVSPSTGDVLRTAGKLSNDGKAIFESERGVPVVGKSDVLICGAGPAGIAAALSAARAGASVQLIDVAGCLGGVWTVGLLTKILDAGNKKGIMSELLQKFAERGSQVAVES
ncbi:MAG: FAD-dependent oxidoreductase, partial [Fuerstiella sp.]|nr:FAD-dependent oxidoreductase [Fuerstiella sp.]